MASISGHRTVSDKSELFAQFKKIVKSKGMKVQFVSEQLMREYIEKNGGVAPNDNK